MAQFLRAKRHRAASYTWRLVFSYEGSAVRLISRQTVKMVPPPSDPVREKDGRTGFWYELRDSAGQTIYQRVIENPIRFAVEVRSDEPARPFNWEKVSEPKGTFVLLTPDIAQARTLVLFSSPLRAEAVPGPAEEIALFDLAQVPEEKE